MADNLECILEEDNAGIKEPEERYKLKRQIAEAKEYTDKRASAHAFASAGKIAENEFYSTKSLNWAKRWYNSSFASAKMNEELDQRNSAIGYSFAGDAAKEMYDKTKKRSWIEKAVKCYKATLEYYSKNPSHDMKETESIIRSHVSFLSGLITRLNYN